MTVLPEGWEDIKEHLITGDVICEDMTAVGANTVVMPKNRLLEGAVIGALSFVPPEFPFEPWSVYAGVPIRFIKRRNRVSVLQQREKLEQYMKRLGTTSTAHV